MPYIIQKRSDIPAGVLQTLGITPNTSQRNPTSQLVGQTGYRIPITNTLPLVTAGIVLVEVTGLTAFLLGSISDGTGAEATATLTVDTKANLADGETFTISDGTTTTVFEINKSGNHIVTIGRVEVDISGATTAANVSLICTNVINGVANLAVTAVDGGGTVALTNNNQNIALASQNNTANAETLGGAGAITDFTGATASDALTPAAAAVNAADILAELGYGASTAAASLSLAAVNAALTSGALTPTLHASLLDLLAGRQFVLPAAANIGTTSFTPAGSFDDSIGIRRVYDTEALKLSFGQGQLAIMATDAFTYLGTAGAGVAVYNDDGTLYTG